VHLPVDVGAAAAHRHQEDSSAILLTAQRAH